MDSVRACDGRFRQLPQVSSFQQIICFVAFGLELAVAELGIGRFAELLHDAVCFFLLTEGAQHSGKLELRRLLLGLERNRFPQAGQCFLRFSQFSQHESELILRVEIFRFPGGSKLKFRLCLGVIAQSPVHHAEQDVPRRIIRFLAHIILGRATRVSKCGYIHQRLDLRE